MVWYTALAALWGMLEIGAQHLYIFQQLRHADSTVLVGRRRLGVNCGRGSFQDAAGTCKLCAPGRYDDGAAEGTSTCASCPPGTWSDAGNDRCHRTVGHWLKEWQGATTLKILNASWPVTLQLQTLSLPGTEAGATPLYGNVNLSYGFDLQPTPDALAWNSSCGSNIVWEQHNSVASFELHYSDFTACRLKATSQDGTGILAGYAKLFVLLETPSGVASRRVLDTVPFHVEVRLPQALTPSVSLDSLAPIAAPWHPYQALAFNSLLQLSPEQGGAPFANTVPLLAVGSVVWLRQEVQAKAAPTLSWLWFSTSLDPFEQSATQANLTGQFWGCYVSEDVSVTSVNCAFTVPDLQEDLVLHAVSFLVSTPTGALFSHGSIRCQVRSVTYDDTTSQETSEASQSPTTSTSEASQPPTTSTAEASQPPIRSTSEASQPPTTSTSEASQSLMTLTGRLDILLASAAEAARFVEDVAAQRGVGAALRNLLGTFTHEVIVTLELVSDSNSRRLREVRRVTAATTVRASYTIVLPPAYLSNAAAKLESASREEYSRAVRAAIQAEAGPGAYEVLNVASSEQPPADVPLQRNTTNTTDSSLGDSLWDSLLEGPTPYLIGGAVLVLLVFALTIAIFCCCRRTSGCSALAAALAPKPPPGPARIPGAPLRPAPLRPAAIPIVGGPGGLPISPVGDVMFGELQKILEPPTAMKAALGIGKDVKEKDQVYNNLSLHCAWAIEPRQAGVYLAWKDQVEQEVQGYNAAVETLTDEASESFGMDVCVNEKLLLHGTEAKNVEGILNQGLTDKHTKRTLFGHGIYFAEDPSKMDQYTDRSDMGTRGLEQLHQTLYQAFGLDHPGEVHYAFVCQVILGTSLHTAGLTDKGRLVSSHGAMLESVVPVFADEGRKNQLINIPGAGYPFHSLIGEKGPKLERHREFVVYDSKSVLLKYLVAYKRCWTDF